MTGTVYYSYDFEAYENLSQAKSTILWCLGLKIHQSEINSFDFETEFSRQKLENDSRYDHSFSTIANYQGSPLVLGGLRNSKLEMFDQLENIWIEKAEYPYTDQYVSISDVVNNIFYQNAQLLCCINAI